MKKLQNKTIFYLITVASAILLIIGIILIAIGNHEYQQFINDSTKNLATKPAEIFIYGIFLLVLGLLLFILDLFVANDVFNKKLNKIDQ